MENNIKPLLMEHRTITQKFQTRETETGEKYISGYFSVFNSNYEMWAGVSESIDPRAFDGTLDRDIRALTNHDSTLVLGRNKNNTLVLKIDERGLWGEILINPKDQDAINLYERVLRGDVNQCSIGFNILSEEYTEDPETGNVHWTIKALELWEVSVVTFPAYEDTEVSARKKDYENIMQRKCDAWKEKMLKRLKGDNYGN